MRVKEWISFRSGPSEQPSRYQPTWAQPEQQAFMHQDKNSFLFHGDYPLSQPPTTPDIRHQPKALLSEFAKLMKKDNHRGAEFLKAKCSK